MCSLKVLDKEWTGTYQYPVNESQFKYRLKQLRNGSQNTGIVVTLNYKGDPLVEAIYLKAKLGDKVVGPIFNQGVKLKAKRRDCQAFISICASALHKMAVPLSSEKFTTQARRQLASAVNKMLENYHHNKGAADKEKDASDLLKKFVRIGVFTSSEERYVRNYNFDHFQAYRKLVLANRKGWDPYEEIPYESLLKNYLSASGLKISQWEFVQRTLTPSRLSYLADRSLHLLYNPNLFGPRIPGCGDRSLKKFQIESVDFVEESDEKVSLMSKSTMSTWFKDT